MSWPVFQPGILLEGQSGPWRLVLGANFFRKGAKRTIPRHTWCSQRSRVCISNAVSHLEVFRCERINIAKQNLGWIDFFFMLSILEAKIFQCGFLEEHNVCENNRYWSSMKKNEVAIMATKPDFFSSKKEILVPLATVSGAILSPGTGIKILCLC